MGWVDSISHSFGMKHQVAITLLSNSLAYWNDASANML